MLNLPNILTLSRIATLPILIGLLFVPEIWAAWTALALYVLSALTDFLDGWIARKQNIVSEFGTFLDPISDKIFVVSLLFVLVGIGRLPEFWIIAPIIIVIRELLVSGLREFLGPKNVKLPVSKLAKWKTTFQMLALGFLIIGPFAPYALITGQWLLALAAALTLITGWGYLKTGMTHIQS